MSSTNSNSSNSNSKPDERRREEARLARVNQAKPLAEPDNQQAVHGDNSFSREYIRSSDSDPLSRKIQEILGPFARCLTSVLDTGQPPPPPPPPPPPSQTQQNNNVGSSKASTKQLNTASTSESKKPHPKQQPSTLPTTQSKPSKQPVSNQASASNESVLTSSSSPLAQTVSSPQSSKDIPIGDGNKDGSQPVKEHTPPQLPMSSKLKPASSSVSTRSPAKEASASHTVHTSSSKSKSVVSSLDTTSSSLAPEVAVQSGPLPPLSGSKDHQNIQTSHAPKQSLPATSSAPSTSISPVLSASSRTSPTTFVKSSSSPHQRPKSTTPPKGSIIGLNGLSTSNSKLNSSLPVTKSSVQSTEKNKLKLQIPTENNALSSKSDLNDIFKEMTEVQPLHSAIETPQKSDKMSFSVSQAIMQERLQSKDILKPTITQDPLDKKTDKPKGHLTVKDEPTPAAQEDLVAFKAESAQASAEAKQERSPAVQTTSKDEEIVKPEPCLTLEVTEKDAPVDSSKCIVGRKSGKSVGKTIGDSDDSILARDLDLSEDSDAESASEDNTSASQSKKGKVISTPSGAPVKRVQSDESSSSSSSSSSDSDSDEDDNEEKDEHIDKPLEFRKSDRRSSSSSSNSSSDSSSESESEADEDEDEAKAEASEEVKMAPEKTPSPVYKTSSIGTPNSVDNQDTSISWSLGNFIQSGKKNSTSPVAASPSKPFSPPPIHASLAPVHPKEHSDLTHPRTLKAIGPCKSMPFDVQFSSKHSGDEAYDHQSDDETGEVFKSKPSHQPSVRKHSSSSVKDLKARTDQVEDNRNHWAKNSRTMESPPNKKPGVTSVLRSNDPVKKSEASSISSLERNTSSKKHPSRAGSSSDDEIDVVGYTPEKPKHQSNNVQQKGKSEMPLNFPGGALSTSSDEDNHKLLATDKNAPNHIPKHTKRKVSAKGDSSNIKDISKDTPNPGGSKDSILPSDLESMIHPPNLLSPIHTAHSPSPAPSTKPLPSFRNSFSPPPPKARSPIVTVSQSGDGSPAPRLVVRVQKALVNDKQLKRLKEKQEKIINGGKISKEIKSVEPSAKSEVASDSQKEARVPPFSDNKSFISVHSTSSIKDKNPSSLTQSDKVANGTVSKTKRKAAVSETDDIGDGTADHNHKIKKPHRKTINPLLEPTSTSSTSSVGSDISTTNVADSKFNKSFNTSVDSLPNKPSAVKNLDFAQKDETDSPLDESKSEPLKSSKRKIENGDESLSKKVRPELVSETAPSTEKNTSNTPSQPTSVRSRRDSNASSSSRGSQQSLKKPSRRSSTSSNKNSNNNNNIDKKSNAHITNGPDLPFHHYVNGNSRGLPSNLPVPEDIQLQKTEHYLARAKEHKHMADNKKDKLARFEPYLRSGLNFFLAGYTIEQGKKDLNASYSLYNDTSNLLQYVIRMRANSSSNPDSSDRERKLIVLIIRLRAFLNHRLYTLRKPEVSKLKKVIDSEQSKLQHSSNPAASAAASSTSTTSSSNTNSSNKAHAPSPHQSSWNKNSTGTPSPMSPTPSPATSVSSQGSCELVQGKIANGTSQISPSPGMVSVQQRVHTVTQKYFTLTSHIVKALELWDQADAETKGLEDFFATVDAACGVLTFHSDPPTIVRYIKHALRLLYL